MFPMDEYTLHDRTPHIVCTEIRWALVLRNLGLLVNLHFCKFLNHGREHPWVDHVKKNVFELQA